MAVSYVLVTLAAVLVVEAVLIAVASTTIGATASERDLVNAAHSTALDIAKKYGGEVAATGHLPAEAAPATTTEAPRDKPRPATIGGSGDLVIPDLSGSCTAAGRASTLQLLVSVSSGRVLSSSYPACYPIGEPGPAEATSSARQGTRDGVAWAVQPVVVAEVKQDGRVYVQAPLVDTSGGLSLANVRPLVTPGLAVLAGAVPVGLLFGYATMHRPVRRLRRLAETTRALADGDLDRRVAVTGRDEVSTVERSVNRMAEQLSQALAAERALAGAHARLAERARIARELHDSVAQQLFSLRLLAGGIDRALPADSPLRPQIQSVQRSADAAGQDLRALLLELRPVELAGGGLGGALEQLCAAYRSRLGVQVSTRLEEVELTADREHALLRIAQESVANAVRHGRASEISVELSAERLSIKDNGGGFDQDAPVTGMGLALMRERAAEVGAELIVTSRPGAGTTVEARLP
jgi:two-component system, NarL family, sensor histidine kinase LiaS